MLKLFTCSWHSFLTNVIVYVGDPLGVELVIPKCYEGQEVVPITKYFGGQEGVGKYIWFRTKDKLHESSLMELANDSENVDICGEAL